MSEQKGNSFHLLQDIKAKYTNKNVKIFLLEFKGQSKKCLALKVFFFIVSVKSTQSKKLAPNALQFTY